MTKEDLQQIAELLKPIHEELTDLRAGQEELKANVSGLETEVRRTRMLVEMQDHKIGLIAEQYTDIAETVYFAASVPEYMQIAEMLVMPTNQATGTIVSRK